MSPTVVPIDWNQFGLVGAVLILMWYVLNVGKQLFLASRKREEPQTSQIAQLACMRDPLYVQRLHEIHDHTKRVDEHIVHGEFGCQWKDREEVRDYIDITKRQVVAMESMVREMQLLRQELVTTRNGRKP